MTQLRRQLACWGQLAGALVILATLSCTSKQPSETDGLRKVQVGIIPIAEVAQLYVGIERGIFADHGIELELVPMAGGAKIMQVLGPNGVDIGFSNVVSLILFRSQGHDFVALGGATYETPDHINHALLVRKDSDIRDASDLSGARIAVNTLQNIEDLMLRRFLESNAVDASTVRLRPVPFPVMASVLEQGDVDAICAVEPFITLAANEGGARVLANQYLALTDRSLVATYVTYTDWIKRNPALAKDFLDALGESTDYLNAHPGETRRIVGEFTSIPPQLLTKIGLPSMVGKIDRPLLQSLSDDLYRRGWADRQVEASELLYQP